MPGTAMAYGFEDGQDARQQPQSFGGYNTAATMVYNVAQPRAQNPVYDAQQFGSQRPAAMQMMMLDVASTYFRSETGSTGGSGLQESAQGSNESANVCQQSNAMSDERTMPSVGTDVYMAEDDEHPDGALEERWVNYQRQLGTIFQEIMNRSLESASETLLSVTSRLLSQVADRGLNLDNTNLHADRIKLWVDFNHAWLGLGQRQIELMTSSQPSRSQGLMSKAMIKKMGNELIRLCNGIERYGLIDYQYGVWEEQITAVLEDCLDLYEASEEAGGGGGAR